MDSIKEPSLEQVPKIEDDNFYESECQGVVVIDNVWPPCMRFVRSRCIQIEIVQSYDVSIIYLGKALYLLMHQYRDFFPLKLMVEFLLR